MEALFPFQQLDFASVAPSVSSERAVLTSDAVARNEIGDPISADGIADSAGGSGHMKVPGDLAIGGSPAEGNVEQGFPSLELKIGAPEVEVDFRRGLKNSVNQFFRQHIVAGQSGLGQFRAQ